MKPKIRLTLELSDRYRPLIEAIREYLFKTGYKSGKTIFIKDVFKYALELVSDHIGFEIDDKVDLEFTTASNLSWKKETPEDKLQKKLERNNEFLREELRLARILSNTDKWPSEPLKEYEKDYKPKGLSIQEYIKMKELELWSVRSNNTDNHESMYI